MKQMGESINVKTAYRMFISLTTPTAYGRRSVSAETE